LLVMEAFGEVARHFDVADELSILIQRSDDDIRPERGSVLADAPVLLLEVPVCYGLPKLAVELLLRVPAG
jgi:hypothetical protein